MVSHRRKEQYAKGWGVESHNRGNLGKDLDPQERQGTSVGEGKVGGEGHHRILLAPQQPHLPASEQRALLPSASPSPTPCVPDLRLPAIPEGWPHHLWEANHLRGFPWPWGLHSRRAVPSKRAPGPRNARASSSQPQEVRLHCRVVLPVLVALGKHTFVSQWPS